MRNQLTNLLPLQRVRSLRRQYFMRLFAVALIMAAALAIAHALLLIPTFLYARNVVAQGQAVLDEQGMAQSTEEQEAKARGAQLKQTAASLTTLGTLPTASAAVRSIIAVPHPGIALSGFTFTAPQGENAARLGISGSADSRDALRQYVTAVSALPFVTTADLPISAYAQERDIPFTITLTGTLIP